MRELDRVTRARRRVERAEAAGGLRPIQEVLREPARLRIVRALEGERLSVGELAAAIDRRVPATSQHLRILRQLGLVDGRRHGTRVYYGLAAGPEAARLRAVLSAAERRDADGPAR